MELALGAAEVHGPAEPTGPGTRPALRAAKEEEEPREGDEGEEQVTDEGEEAAGAGGVALGDGDVDAVGGEDVDEVGVVGHDDGGAAAVDGRELEHAAVLGEPDALDLALLDGAEELAVAPLAAVGDVGGRLGRGEEGVGEGVGGGRALSHIHAKKIQLKVIFQLLFPTKKLLPPILPKTKLLHLVLC